MDASGLDEDERMTMNRAARSARSRRMDSARRRTLPDENHFKEDFTQTRPASSASSHTIGYTDPADEVKGTTGKLLNFNTDTPVFDNETLNKPDEQSAVVTSPVHKSQNNTDQNKYMVKKTIIQGMMTLALLLNSCSQIKNLLNTGTRHKMFTLLISINILSFTTECVIGVLTWLIFKNETTTVKRKDIERQTDQLHDIVIFLLTSVIVLNIALSTFDIYLYDS